MFLGPCIKILLKNERDIMTTATWTTNSTKQERQHIQIIMLEWLCGNDLSLTLLDYIRKINDRNYIEEGKLSVISPGVSKLVGVSSFYLKSHNRLPYPSIELQDFIEYFVNDKITNGGFTSLVDMTALEYLAIAPHCILESVDTTLSPAVINSRFNDIRNIFIEPHKNETMNIFQSILRKFPNEKIVDESNYYRGISVKTLRGLYDWNVYCDSKSYIPFHLFWNMREG